MPRARRIWPARLVYHVMNRAIEGTRLFDADGDYDAFEVLLLDAVTRFPVQLFEYVVMPNHWHLLCRPLRQTALSELLAWLTKTHAVRWRARRGSIGRGHVYQGPFRAFAVQGDGHFLTVARYIARNPVASELVASPERWSWSSYRRRLHADGAPRALATWPVTAPANWPDIVGTPLPSDRVRRVSTSIATSRPYGSQAWVTRTRRRIESRVAS